MLAVPVVDSDDRVTPASARGSSARPAAGAGAAAPCAASGRSSNAAMFCTTEASWLAGFPGYVLMIFRLAAAIAVSGPGVGRHIRGTTYGGAPPPTPGQSVWDDGGRRFAVAGGVGIGAGAWLCNSSDCPRRGGGTTERPMPPDCRPARWWSTSDGGGGGPPRLI